MTDAVTTPAAAAAIVTGAGGGIGSAIAVALAARGFGVVLADRDAEALDRTVGLLPDGAVARTVVGDVADPDHHVELVEAAEELGGAAVSVLNAGMYLPGFVWETSLEDWRLQVDVDFWGVLHGVRAVVPTMIERGSGHVFATASGAGLIAAPALGPYTASKHAVVGMMESLYHELAKVAPEVHASVICPGNVRTPMAANSLAVAGVDDEVLNDEVAALASTIRSGNDAGQDPATVAEVVVAALDEPKFWLLPQPEVAWGALDRYQRISDGNEPVNLLG